MGYYIETGTFHGKAGIIAEDNDGWIYPEPPAWADIPTGRAIICVVDNGPFEAAAFCYDEDEYEDFKQDDGRPKTYVVIQWERACELTGYPL
tara:strand:- start:78 stop:353 length:276 start_codon:yes stop_codon:yes gene_type:complete